MSALVDAVETNERDFRLAFPDADLKSSHLSKVEFVHGLKVGVGDRQAEVPFVGLDSVDQRRQSGIWVRFNRVLERRTRWGLGLVLGAERGGEE